jgi:hypothetical protein
VFIGGVPGKWFSGAKRERKKLSYFPLWMWKKLSRIREENFGKRLSGSKVVKGAFK